MTISKYQKEVSTSVSASLDSKVMSLRNILLSTLAVVEDSDKTFIEKYKSHLQHLEFELRAVSAYVKRWKVISAMTLVLEVLIAGSLLYITIKT